MALSAASAAVLMYDERKINYPSAHGNFSVNELHENILKVVDIECFWRIFPD